MQINWYPGHMKKAFDQMQEQLKLIDVVIEMVDARIMRSSTNPLIRTLLGTKPCLLVITKSDLADEKTTQEWEAYLREEQLPFLLLDPRDQTARSTLLRLVKDVASPIFQKRQERGLQSQRLRLMVVGVPNVGKSTLLNMLAGRRSANVGNRPGVTKGQQWIKVDDFDLLDTPGVLWPKFEDETTGLHLAFTGAIKDEILDTETLALKLVEELHASFPEMLEHRYDLAVDGKTPLEVMEAIGKRRGFLQRGGFVEYTKVANVLLDEFRKGTIGRISLERPTDKPHESI